ncbi:peptide deformylase [Falsibacillus pallidus]|uniref:Peptide deformylase n=1 Tax=Falsibacillus pallidus TaxID=493781 RepID=A0A370GVH7_9BACI|nr:peptide deformylase [Falsibacillus pallidus]RDI47509.1 peptide deformylase [Falsibacillus pallidus]
MALLPIVKYPAEILEMQCEKVTKFDANLHQLLRDMYETMIAADGVGLAAPQVGVNKQIAIVDVDDETGIIEMINPEILASSGDQLGVEGCLSFPDIYGEVNRPYYVKVKAQDRFGREYIFEAEDFLARAVQHEIDHLNGVLFTSKITRYINESDLERYEEE